MNIICIDISIIVTNPEAIIYKTLFRSDEKDRIVTIIPKFKRVLFRGIFIPEFNIFGFLFCAQCNLEDRVKDFPKRKGK